MKRVLLVGLVSCLVAQAEAFSNKVNFYAGASVVGSWTSSDFHMDYEINDDNPGFPQAKPWANHKENSIGKVGAGFAVGVKKKFENNLFVGGEFGYTLSRAKHHHDFTYLEDLEDDTHQVTDKLDNTVSQINVKHGDELSLALKFGKSHCSCVIY